MRTSPYRLLTPLLLLPAIALAQDKGSAARKLYCWNENGQRICSDALPPEAVNHAREEISISSGIRTGEVQRALTDEERAAAAIQAAQREADLAAEETRRRTDRAMLLSYRNEDDLRRVFNERTAIVDNNVRTARYNVVSLREGLVSLLQAAGNRELSGHPVADDMVLNIRNRHADLLRQMQLQTSFERQRAELDEEIVDILRRYREMKAEAGSNS